MHITSLKQLNSLNKNQYKKVHHIDLSCVHISILPKEIYDCINLVKLNLNNTFIQSIHSDLLELKKLHTIYFPKNIYNYL